MDGNRGPASVSDRFCPVSYADRPGRGIPTEADELAGLLWEDVDLDADPPTLSITGSVKRRPNGSVWRDSEPKRATAARRTLALPPIAAAALAERKAASGTSVGLVFATATGNPFNPRHVYKVFARVARRAGIEGSFTYLMRHSAASLMLDAGASLDEVADVLGDDPATLLRHYRHRVRPVASGGLRMGDVLGGRATAAG